MQYHCTDTAAEKIIADWPRKFSDRQAAAIFINKLPQLLQQKGFVAAALDSVTEGQEGSRAWLYAGPRYQWVVVRPTAEHKSLLDSAGWPFLPAAQPIPYAQLDSLQTQVLRHLEVTGHPFGRIWLDGVQLAPDTLRAVLRVDRGALYRFDTLALEGAVSIRSSLLARLSGIAPGMAYDPRRVAAIESKLAAIPYLAMVQPPVVKMRATGAVVQLYLKPRNSNQAQVLLGIQPGAAIGKTRSQLTGEARLLLHNSLGGGETIGFNWQRLQVASPRLQLQYDRPYLLGSAVALGFKFDLLRRDSSWLNIRMHLGGKVTREGRRWLGFFYEQRQTVQGTFDTLALRRTRSLPAVASMAAHQFGIQGGIDADGPFPTSGWELQWTAGAALRRLRPNSWVLALRDPDFTYDRLYDTVQMRTYQLRVQGSAAHYQPLGKMGVLKKAINLGLLQSGTYYTNELFQVGGFRLLRGFAEESEFLSHYLLGSLEYRHRIGGQSYFLGFVDGGGGYYPYLPKQVRLYLGTGVGLALDTKAGMLNLAWAIGAGNNDRLDLRQSKLHLGVVSRF